MGVVIVNGFRIEFIPPFAQLVNTPPASDPAAVRYLLPDDLPEAVSIKLPVRQAIVFAPSFFTGSSAYALSVELGAFLNNQISSGMPLPIFVASFFISEYPRRYVWLFSATTSVGT
jgi:hypothetical protein